MKPTKAMVDTFNEIFYGPAGGSTEEALEAALAHVPQREPTEEMAIAGQQKRLQHVTDHLRNKIPIYAHTEEIWRAMYDAYKP